jgi:hypothetical protein
MNDLSNLWGAAEVKAPAKKEYEDIPTGVYTAHFEDVTLDVTKQTPRLSFRYKITDGELKGRSFFVNQSLNPVGISIVKTFMSKLGYAQTPASLDDLVTALKTYCFTGLEVYVSHRKTEFDGKSYTHYSAAINNVLKTDELGF